MPKMSCEFSVENYCGNNYVLVIARGYLSGNDGGIFEKFESNVQKLNKEGYGVVVIDASGVQSIDKIYLSRLYQLGKNYKITIFGANPSHVVSLDVIANGTIKSVETLDDALEQAFPNAALKEAV